VDYYYYYLHSKGINTITEYLYATVIGFELKAGLLYAYHASKIAHFHFFFFLSKQRKHILALPYNNIGKYLFRQ
jgi:hypothetical protein